MQTGAPAFGTPEYVNAVHHRRADRPPLEAALPVEQCDRLQCRGRSGGHGIRHVALGGGASHANFVYHATGWLEGGLTTSFEKVIVDAEMISAMRAWLMPLDVSDDALAFDAIAATPPGGHFFGAGHTLAALQDRRSTLPCWPISARSKRGGSTAPGPHRPRQLDLEGTTASYEEPPMEQGRARGARGIRRRRRKIQIAAEGLAA